MRIKQLICKALELCARSIVYIMYNASCNFFSHYCTPAVPASPVKPEITVVSPPPAALPALLILPSRCHSSHMSLLPGTKTWGHSLGCPFREKPHPADFMNCSHFPLSRLTAPLPTVSPSVVSANDFSPQHVSSAFASENRSEQQDCFNSHLVLMMPFKCIKRISKHQTGGPLTGDNSY